jgi:lipopolysaccharide transport system ATP-binding protein
MSEPRIIAEGLGKQFKHRATQTPRTWGQLLSGSWRRARPAPFWALRDVSFSVNAGEMLGVIGPNGAGKSTLLCLLSGLSDPTTGRARINGRIGALLELGGGFVDDLTGRENAILAGVAAGLTRAEVRARLDDIVEFAEIREFFDEPVRTFSTGMRMRLAFAVAVHTEPEVLLVDEFLAVGDLAFQTKCRARIADLKDDGCAIVLVSHGIGDVRETCDRVLWLRDGRVAALDTAESVTELYQAEMHQRSLERTPAKERRRLADGRKLRRAENRLGSLEVEIARVELLSGTSMHSGDPFALELTYRSRQPVTAPIFVVSITREDGTVCLDTNTQGAHVSTEGLPPEGAIRFSIPRLEVGAGRYFANVGIFDAQWSHAYDYHWQVYPFTVDGSSEHKGVLAPKCRWDANPTGLATPTSVSSGSYDASRT